LSSDSDIYIYIYIYILCVVHYSLTIIAKTKPLQFLAKMKMMMYILFSFVNFHIYIYYHCRQSKDSALPKQSLCQVIIIVLHSPILSPVICHTSTLCNIPTDSYRYSCKCPWTKNLCVYIAYIHMYIYIYIWGAETTAGVPRTPASQIPALVVQVPER
jgi:hypothetical protein